MQKEKFTHLIYTPKNKTYNLVKDFKHLVYGNVIGYASEEGEVYFRLEDDFENFVFTETGSFTYKPVDKPILVKFKLDNEWKPFMYQSRKLISLEEYIDEELKSLELQYQHALNMFYKKFKYYYLFKVNTEKGMWTRAKENNFDEFETKQQKMIFLKDKINFIKNKI